MRNLKQFKVELHRTSVQIAVIQKHFYITIGAVLANRLTEVENWNVLLLEAGGDETEISDVPLMAGYLQLSKLDWKYKSEPQGTACLGKISLRFNTKNDRIIKF